MTRLSVACYVAMLTVDLQAGPFLDAFSYHFYPLMYNRSGNIPGILKPLNCTADHVRILDCGIYSLAYHSPNLQLLSPITLNRVHYWAKRVTSLGQKYAPHAEVWLGETGSCVGGGGDGISDRFVDAMEVRMRLSFILFLRSGLRLS